MVRIQKNENIIIRVSHLDRELIMEYCIDHKISVSSFVISSCLSKMQDNNFSRRLKEKYEYALKIDRVNSYNAINKIILSQGHYYNNIYNQVVELVKACDTPELPLQLIDNALRVSDKAFKDDKMVSKFIKLRSQLMDIKGYRDFKQECDSIITIDIRNKRGVNHFEN